jgi:hypothetical protein
MCATTPARFEWKHFDGPTYCLNEVGYSSFFVCSLSKIVRRGSKEFWEFGKSKIWIVDIDIVSWQGHVAFTSIRSEICIICVRRIIKMPVILIFVLISSYLKKSFLNSAN